MRNALEAEHFHRALRFKQRGPVAILEKRNKAVRLKHSLANEALDDGSVYTSNAG